VQEGLQRDTGKSLDEWVAIARTCPETAPRRREQWLKEHHGLGQNRAMLVLDAAFPSSPTDWKATLWSEPVAAAVLERLIVAVSALPNVVEGQRKGYTPFARDLQFAAARPQKGGGAVLGLALPPGSAPRLSAPSRRESWSERLTAVVELSSPDQVDDELAALLAEAHSRS
jgi:hypothetical protein